MATKWKSWTVENYILCYWELRKLWEIELAQEISDIAFKLQEHRFLMKCCTSDVNIENLKFLKY